MVRSMVFRWHKTSSADKVEPYSRLAEIYDYVMRHVDYVHWADYIQSIFSRCRVTPRTILELACGTGSLAEILCQRGYDVTGVDRSEAMIAVARRKAAHYGDRLSFMPGDMTDPPVRTRFDAILCMYDSINYLLDLDAVRCMLEQTRSRLTPDGLMIFDACTEINSRRYFHKYTEKEGTDEFAYIRHSEYLEQERIQVNEFRLFFKRGDRFDHHVERHEQRIYPVSQVMEACRLAGFDVLGAFDGFSFTPATEQSYRVHFVLRHPESGRLSAPVF